ncbi:peroxisomal multifunctional enzyme type 2-like [Contarinia nasturtii]|uniref:peroxisomal multifunctional enzyme type 2-like n=1 Tax=Contarinia nasturtii TaxID=265458 RepID=UPI0012D3C6A7|nr:peroxisomal multifunctional enzyme type 2-like [Contarinia nasturtii]
MWKIRQLKQFKSPTYRTLTILADGNGTNNNKVFCSRITLDFENPESPLPLSEVNKTNLKNYQFPVIKISYDRNDVVEHAKSIGIKADNKYADLYLNQSHKKFQVLPSFLLPFSNKILIDLCSFPSTAWKLSFEHLLHGEHYIQQLKQLPPEGIVNLKIKTSDVMDKGKGTLYCFNMNIYDENNGETYFTMDYHILEVGTGGFIGNKSNPHMTRKVTPPNSNYNPPDSILEFQTFIPKDGIKTELSDSDLNMPCYSSLHPHQRYGTNFEFLRSPIAHGRYTFAGVMKSILFKYANGNVEKFKAAKVRFAKPVYPGDNILISTWKADESRITFQGDVKRDGENIKVLTDGYIDLDM